MSGDYLDWAEKYRPTSLKDVVGNDAAVKALRQWAETFSTGKKAVILHGGPGIGKTSAAIALANDLGWDYIELNASDTRTKDAINKIAGAASKAGTFEGAGGRKLIILDEADNIHGTSDRGGEAAILNVIKNANQPIIMIANDPYEMSKPLREAALMIPFRSILTTSIVKVLKKICADQEISCDPEALMKIAERTKDLRSAINDLQAAAMGSKRVTVEDVSTADRDVPETVFKVMGMIFRGHDMTKSLDAMRKLDERPDDVIGWVDENLPRSYEDDDLEAGYDAISKADMYLGRVMKRQDYGMWRYASFMMTCGVNNARKRKYGGFVKYSPPTYWQKLGRAKSARTVRDSLAKKIGSQCHTSKAEARSTYIPFLKFIFDKNDYAVRLSAQLKLDEDEIAYLLDAKKAAKKVSEIYRKSREMIEEEIEHEIDVFGHFSRPEKKLEVEPEEAEPEEKEKKKAGRKKPAKARSRDGGELDEDAAMTEEVTIDPAPQETEILANAEEKKEEALEEDRPKKQRTLFDF
ncbi:replication protein C [Methanocella sp. CWC-04]|uniref:Replication factor C large subunit n=1 Tax=Methanooceanicella nereidis TaxID=2052831 RepID=A0AAP2RB87_9EURY|nr:replication factor C large subunit [Methanocella sp. CWC-04]MCD1294213.1 replication protein C [Methanocella sp. CWC-04]